MEFIGFYIVAFVILGLVSSVLRASQSPPPSRWPRTGRPQGGRLTGTGTPMGAPSNAGRGRQRLDDFAGQAPSSEFDSGAPSTEFEGAAPPAQFDAGTPATDFEGLQDALDFEGRQAADDSEGRQGEGQQSADDPEGKSLLDTGLPLAPVSEAVPAAPVSEERWLATPEDLVRGVALAEILAPARARRPWRGWVRGR